MRWCNRVQLIGFGHDNAEFVLLWRVDATAQRDEQLAHHLHVADARHVGQTVFAGRQKTGGHLL
jgi:hypothetical protein